NEPELDITPHPSQPTDSTQEQPDITTPSPEPQPEPQSPSQEIPALSHYTDVRDSIMENLEQSESSIRLSASFCCSIIEVYK
nr:hypothetical protein [Xenococcaceae cyanobacterium MO_234.B1]